MIESRRRREAGNLLDPKPWSAILAPGSAAKVLALVLPAALIMNSIFNGTGYSRFLLTAAAIYAIGALSMVVITGFAGQISLAQATMMGLGAFLTGMLGGTRPAGDAPMPLGIAMILGPLLLVPIGIAVGLPALRLRGMHFALITLSFAYVTDLIVFTSPKFSSGSAQNIVLNRGSAYGVNFADERVYFFAVVAVLLVIALGIRNLGRSSFGRRLVAIRDSELAAAAVGIDVARTKVIAFGVSSFIAGIGGALYAGTVANVASVFKSFDLFHSLLLFSVVVIAGIRSVPAGFIAGAIYIFLPEYSGRIDNPDLAAMVSGGGAILMTIVLPGGLVSLPGVIVRRLMNRKDRRGIGTTREEEDLSGASSCFEEASAL